MPFWSFEWKTFAKVNVVNILRKGAIAIWENEKNHSRINKFCIFGCTSIILASYNNGSYFISINIFD